MTRRPIPEWASPINARAGPRGALGRGLVGGPGCDRPLPSLGVAPGGPRGIVQRSPSGPQGAPSRPAALSMAPSAVWSPGYSGLRGEGSIPVPLPPPCAQLVHTPSKSQPTSIIPSMSSSLLTAFSELRAFTVQA